MSLSSGEELFSVEVADVSDGTFAVLCPHCELYVTAVLRTSVETAFLGHMNEMHFEPKSGQA